VENIKDISLERLREILSALGLKPYAYKQVYHWLYNKCASSFEEMTNLSKEARRLLSERFYIQRLEIKDVTEDTDGVKKLLFGLSDGMQVESVIIPSENRLTLCISSQVGCKMGCRFCRTARMGFKRNLNVSEILDQVIEAKRFLTASGLEITNLVFMGMGEPLDNYDNVKAAINILKDEGGLGIAKRRITLSTSGLADGILKMAEDKLGVKLAVSLNATTDEQRRYIMPIANAYTIDDILRACLKYTPFGGRWKTTFEYVMIDGFNDSKEDATRLVSIMRRLPSKVNLIPFNPFDGCEFKKPPDERVLAFYEFLTEKGIQVNIRISRGVNIMAACGQLAASLD